MYSAVGVFSSWEAAQGAAKKLGLAEDQVSAIGPGRREPEETGIGAPLGGAVGGALGAAAGSSLGTVAGSMMLPGVGPVVATGVVAALLLGAGAAVVGAAAGKEVEDATEVHPAPSDVFFCEEALRRGRSIVVAVTETAEQADAIRTKLAGEGGESLDVTRQDWWRDLREAERAAYIGDFVRDEELYRSGIESALEPQNRGKALRENDKRPDAFRKGYERGLEYYSHLAVRLT